MGQISVEIYAPPGSTLSGNQHLGRRKLLSAAQVEHARAMIAEGKETSASMAALLGVSRATLWRALKPSLQACRAFAIRSVLRAKPVSSEGSI